MNGFQWIACSLLGLALVRDLWPRPAGASPARLRAVRILVWCTAIATIVEPQAVTGLANLLGIGRGADIVLYVLTLAFAAATFYFYARQLRLRRDVSALASHIALMEAARGGQAGTSRADRSS